MQGVIFSLYINLVFVCSLIVYFCMFVCCYFGFGFVVLLGGGLEVKASKALG